MATSPTNKHVQEEDEVQTDEVEPAKTTEEEVEVRTEEEDELKKEATESLLESDPTRMRDEEFDEGTENHNRQEKSITVHTKLYHDQEPVTVSVLLCFLPDISI